MKRRVNSHQYGIIHCVGRCEECREDWGDVNVAKVRRQAKAHTLKTGHETTVETGTSTTYTLERLD